jgi:MFS family permease
VLEIGALTQVPRHGPGLGTATVERDLGGGLATPQWVVGAYALTLGALMLVGGSMGDVFGSRRILLAGVGGFGLASVACAVASTAMARIPRADCGASPGRC